MSEYLKSESMLLSNKPDEGFSNTIFLEELRIFCPVVYHFVLCACGIQESDVKVKGTAANGVALATAVMCRLRNPKASALHYRISTVLFHSGAKHDDLVRLNRLGVSMSPKQMVRAQSEMSKQLEGKVNVWEFWLSSDRNKPLIDTCEVAEPIRRCVRWRTQVFKIEGFVCKRFLPSPPPSFIFCLSFHFSRGQNRESRSSVFLCSVTARKRLLRRLPCVSLVGGMTQLTAALMR